ncbi:CaiB/BaiF CoA transferase family protein [Oceanicola sp. S124]|uniref:CaiB/BaiF CoA transferase family protein n=1 Tax=Oceanicola sp. S124 TaxID=1042378 RepID=UPI0002558C9F|nr:CoA transferase [Oceanicola sp. S124]
MTALKGLKVADFSWVGAGPRATKDLSDNGATVVKVESRKRLDLGRLSPPFANGDSKNPDASVFFCQVNTSKLSVTINLSDPEGQAVARRLCDWADVVVENFSPGYMARIGLDYATLSADRPELIMLSVSVAGRSGPMAGYRGYGNIAAAQSGHSALTGWPGGDPHLPPFAYGDVTAPLFASVGVMAALEHRDRTGLGCHLDVSQIESMVQVIPELLAKDDVVRMGNRDAVMAPHGAFPTEGPDRWIAIALEDPALWPALCEELGAPTLAMDTRFVTAEARKANENALEAEIAALTAGFERFALAEALRARGIAAAPVADGRDLCEARDLIDGGHFVAPEHPVIGPAKMPALAMRLHDTPWHMGPAPILGQHNDQVYYDILGMGRAEVESLIGKGALA